MVTEVGNLEDYVIEVIIILGDRRMPLSMTLVDFSYFHLITDCVLDSRAFDSQILTSRDKRLKYT